MPGSTCCRRGRQRRHKTGVASSPGPFGGRQAEPARTGCRGGRMNLSAIDWGLRILRLRNPRGNYPTRATKASQEALACAAPACPAKAPYCASPTLRLRQLSATILVVQLDVPRLLPTTKSWLDRNVSISELNHKNALERVRAGQCPVPPAAAEAAQRRHKTGVASSPGSFGGRQAEPVPTCCRGIAHESGKHKLDFPNSSRSEASRAWALQGLRGCSILLRCLSPNTNDSLSNGSKEESI